MDPRSPPRPRATSVSPRLQHHCLSASSTSVDYASTSRAASLTHQSASCTTSSLRISASTQGHPLQPRTYPIVKRHGTCLIRLIPAPKLILHHGRISATFLHRVPRRHITAATIINTLPHRRHHSRHIRAAIPHTCYAGHTHDDTACARLRAPPPHACGPVSKRCRRTPP